MDACETREATDNSTSGYRSRPGALIWFFRKSRDLWKAKYQSLRTNLKLLGNQLAAVTKSRAAWRRKAEQAKAELVAVQRQNEYLRAQVLQFEEREKKTRRH